MSLSSGSCIVSQATLVGLTLGDYYCCFSFTLVTIVSFNAAVFSVKIKDLKVHSGCSRSRECLPFVEENNRPCKHLGVAPSLAKILSFKYFREFSLLKQGKRAHFRCKVLPIAAPNRMNP